MVDLVGFTAASEKADPEDVRARLRPYHARVKQEIERFGGTVEKFVGDAVMADYGFVFGRGLALLGSARCLVALGRRTDATPVLRQARDIFAGLGAAPALAEVDVLLGDQPAAARAAK